MILTGDGGFALAGYTMSMGGNPDFLLVRTDSFGNMLWTKTYDGTSYDVAYSVVLTGDGGFALAGYTMSMGGNPDFWLVRTDSSGNMLWTKTYGGTSYDVAYSVVLTGDGGFALAGYTMSMGGNPDFLLVRTDSSGNMLWTKTYGGTNYDVALSVVLTGDGGFALAGYTMSLGGNPDFWLVRTDSSGNMLWSQDLWWTKL